MTSKKPKAKTKSQSKTRGAKGKDRPRKRYLDFMSLTNQVLNDLAFWMIGIVGIFNIVLLGFVYSMFPAVQMTRAIIEEAAKGMTRDDAVLAVLEQMDPSRIVLFGSLKAFAILAVGFLLIMLVLSYFKGRIYLSLKSRKISKGYLKQFFVFNVLYYLFLILLSGIIMISLKPMPAAKIILLIALAYAYLTPLLRIHFQPAEKYFRNYWIVLKRSFSSAVQLPVLLRMLLMALLFMLLYVISAALGLLGLAGGLLSAVLFLYLSAVSRVIVFNAVENVKRKKR